MTTWIVVSVIVLIVVIVGAVLVFRLDARRADKVADDEQRLDVDTTAQDARRDRPSRR
ncbi:hypothetical protein HJ590_09265 [Naumannella sp. ID2617S]|uniref:hypothetical protein n=1 Tax=Enemella dayhoffiae TaxID=2016507 RepID=UPI001488846C|nr:hypothetical protein [Enemella dayhoffiae]NNG19760.1 hypothetical protein [Naumannella sp. ID2617S]